MANVRQGNTEYVDATGSVNSGAVTLLGVILTASSAGAILELRDSAGTYKKLDLRVATSGDSKHFDFTASPIFFPVGLKVQTLTNAIATLIYTT